MLDIPKVRQRLEVDACRKFADGKDFYTLPIIHDHATDSLQGDSFDIALYLNNTYPTAGGGNLFPTQALQFKYDPPTAFPTLLSLPKNDGGYPGYARFNLSIDTLFTAYSGILATNMPLDPLTANEVQAEFARRSGVESMDMLAMKEEDRSAALEAFNEDLADLAKLYKANAEGPFLLGMQASYADFIVGSWLRMGFVAMKRDEWQQLKSWHGGVFGRLHDALDRYAEVH